MEKNKSQEKKYRPSQLNSPATNSQHKDGKTERTENKETKGKEENSHAKEPSFVFIFLFINLFILQLFSLSFKRNVAFTPFIGSWVQIFLCVFE